MLIHRYSVERSDSKRIIAPQSKLKSTQYLLSTNYQNNRFLVACLLACLLVQLLACPHRTQTWLLETIAGPLPFPVELLDLATGPGT
ncbi:uncharacterized protein BO88DRAFT_403994 [Aspergillus vadensis CBS 113365]|uniref:Uncharacterized protein n=1 Tax=Aspergillus vadensis (strain CBS 113365 / IMI 142717 / IBT 24658) TaxID=1448311 RepID=A0A319BE20_ASPVC|nr:hypothetical protein BO88DRAFT_403994 [Aspergillus vadensis CBS 113365]PYH70361.1 hypothetical protein BO88DRAFT_403994 [Aspergillus vadensis CBS 113365]